MHTHDGTVRLLIKLVSILLVGLAAYLILFFGIDGMKESNSVAVSATSTPSAHFNFRLAYYIN